LEWRWYSIVAIPWYGFVAFLITLSKSLSTHFETIPKFIPVFVLVLALGANIAIDITRLAGWYLKHFRHNTKTSQKLPQAEPVPPTFE
jgi:hypothetical protein